MSSPYKRLDKSDIRLLTISVLDEATISLELQTYPRIAAPQYDAVSYTWGDDKSTTSVICNGLSLEIRTSLFKALPFLHAFGTETRTRPLWIDAVCLNQDDPDEKAVHVSLMGEVYENATRTLVWLGEAADDSDLAMDSVESLTQKLLSKQGDTSFGMSQILTYYNLPDRSDPLWKALKLLQSRTWLFRLWTLQEIVLAKDAVLLCGNKSISWDSLVGLHQAAIKTRLSVMIQFEANPDTPYKQPQIVISHIDFLRKRTKNRNDLTLPMLLTLSVDRGYSLPTDRVWALVGILNKKYQQMIQNARLIDYSKAAISNYHESFLGVVKFHIKYDKRLAMDLIEDNLRSLPNPLLPSWCPDWHTDKGGIPLARWPEALVGFPGGKFRRIEPFMQVNEDSTLELCGLVVDIVECVTTSVGKSLLDLESYPWLVQCLEIINDSTSSLPSDADRASPIASATSTTHPNGTTKDPLVQQRKHAEEVLKNVLYPPGTLLETSPRTVLRCNGRNFFRTRAGRLGIGPADLMENDIMCAMYGARTLWALRPTSHGLKTIELYPQNVEKQTFKLLGSAYTPSLLNGQAWVDKSCQSMQRFRLQ